MGLVTSVLVILLCFRFQVTVLHCTAPWHVLGVKRAISQQQSEVVLQQLLQQLLQLVLTALAPYIGRL
jgi:hypothetical protein